MPTRQRRVGVEGVYAAAKKWVDAALRNDDSLFTPGKAIWTRELLGELRTRFLDQPDVTGSDFYDKLRQQLEGSPPDVYQLVAEALYTHQLVVSTSNSKGKRGNINAVLQWSPTPVQIPQKLADALTPGLVNPGQAYHSYRPYQVGYLVEFVEQWKDLAPEERELRLHDPWNFKDFVMELGPRSRMIRESPNKSRIQRQALLHLVHPDTFEAVVSIDHKNQIAATYAAYVSVPTVDVDRKLVQIRKGVEAERGEDFGFYDPDIRPVWEAGGTPVHLPSPQPEPQKTVRPQSSLDDLATQLFLTPNFLHDIDTLLTDKRQVIFQGPPGTGKTYVAQRLARHLAGSPDRVTLVQFHPSYAYEDFVQGFRPTLRNGQAGFELRDGPLLRAAERAENDEEGANHYLIIDEINRGNLAKVFGELYYLLEYRDDEITLQYQADKGKKFSLPKNLYIIGTMNTADRSIARVDLALRRRFYFVEFHPDAEPIKGVLRRWLKAKHPTMEWVADVVERVNELLESDRHAAIGPSYFMKDVLDDEMVDRVWKHSVLPYIEERLFGGDKVAEDFHLERLKRQSASAVQSEDVADDQNGGDDAQS